MPRLNESIERPSQDDVAARWCSLDTLRPWASNPRRNDGAPVRKVADSIKHFGWGAPVLARRDGRVIAGHTRIKAIELLIVEWNGVAERQRATWHPEAVRSVTKREIPVRHGDWSEREAALLAIADNKLNELAEWNETAVAEILSEYGIRDALLVGFDLKDLDAMANDIAGADQAEDASSALSGLEYRIVIDCESEEQQTMLLERFDAEGLKSKPLIS